MICRVQRPLLPDALNRLEHLRIAKSKLFAVQYEGIFPGTEQTASVNRRFRCEDSWLQRQRQECVWTRRTRVQTVSRKCLRLESGFEGPRRFPRQNLRQEKSRTLLILFLVRVFELCSILPNSLEGVSCGSALSSLKLCHTKAKNCRRWAQSDVCFRLFSHKIRVNCKLLSQRIDSCSNFLPVEAINPPSVGKKHLCQGCSRIVAHLRAGSWFKCSPCYILSEKGRCMLRSFATSIELEGVFL